VVTLLTRDRSRNTRRVSGRRSQMTWWRSFNEHEHVSAHHGRRVAISCTERTALGNSGDVHNGTAASERSE
jgi:hypothetical protein